MSNLTARILTSLLVLPPVLALLFLAPPVYIAAAAVLLAGLAGGEFATMTLARRYAPHRFFAASLSVVVASGVAVFAREPAVAPIVLMTVGPVSLVLFMFSSADLKQACTDAAFTTLCASYAGGLFGALALLAFARGAEGRYWILLLLASVILNDTCAYAAGRLFGRRKLNPRLSPNKTWEGSIGGLIGSMVAVIIVHRLFLVETPLMPVVVLGLVLGAVAQVGDLMESFIKRSFGVKDAGNILPGHGGILDRLDGLMLGAPVVLVFTMLV